MAPTRSRRGLVLAASCTALAASIAVIPSSATAAPRPSLHRVQVQVDHLNREAGDATERYNDARVKFTEANRRLTAVKHRLASRQAQVDALQSTVGRLASAAYKSGGMDTALQILLSDDPESFLRTAAALEQVNRQQSAMLRTVVSARQGLATARLDVRQQRAQAQDMTARISHEKQTIEAKLAEAQALLGTLRGDQRARLNAAQAAASERGHEVASRSRSGGVEDLPNYDGPASGRAATAVQTAYGQLGDPYSYGAAGPGSFDCSGLTMFVWNSAGVSLPHSSSAQYSSARHVDSSDLQPGDLVFYYSPISHVGIYIGGGRIIHAPHPGLSVEIAGLHSMPYVGAARP